MANLSISPSPVLLLLLHVLPFLIPTESADLINKTCKKTPDYNLCVSTLQANSQSSNTSVEGLASMMANVTLSNATNILNYTQELINHNADTELEGRLAYCAEVYISLEQDILPQAISALANGEFGFAKYGISEAGDEVHECEKKIPESFKPPLNDMNRIMQNLCDVCVAIINILLKG
ncbi:cell wall / vacuolar inhibitor of fructosidase 1-like [Euphorbia lathyris]|uniref:cell wall / vacuolar inhibitor of fructosidase 1-like n=1 Tax=Euphorbia lathyris TaxID=212925 RepID=UPI0033133487